MGEGRGGGLEHVVRGGGWRLREVGPAAAVLLGALVAFEWLLVFLGHPVS